MQTLGPLIAALSNATKRPGIGRESIRGQPGPSARRIVSANFVVRGSNRVSGQAACRGQPGQLSAITGLPPVATARFAITGSAITGARDHAVYDDRRSQLWGQQLQPIATTGPRPQRPRLPVS